ITGFLSILVDTSASCHRCLREAALFTWPELVKLMSPPLLAQAAPAFRPSDRAFSSHPMEMGTATIEIPVMARPRKPKAESRKGPRAHLIARSIDNRIDEALGLILIFPRHNSKQDLPRWSGEGKISRAPQNLIDDHRGDGRGHSEGARNLKCSGPAELPV